MRRWLLTGLLIVSISRDPIWGTSPLATAPSDRICPYIGVTVHPDNLTRGWARREHLVHPTSPSFRLFRPRNNSHLWGLVALLWGYSLVVLILGAPLVVALLRALLWALLLALLCALLCALLWCNRPSGGECYRGNFRNCTCSCTCVLNFSSVSGLPDNR